MCEGCIEESSLEHVGTHVGGFEAANLDVTRSIFEVGLVYGFAGQCIGVQPNDFLAVQEEFDEDVEDLDGIDFEFAPSVFTIVSKAITGAYDCLIFLVKAFLKGL